MTLTSGKEQPSAAYLTELHREYMEAPDADGMANGSLPIIPGCQEAQATARSHPCVAEADEDHEFRPLEGVARPVLEDCDECRPDMVTFYLMRRQAD